MTLLQEPEHIAAATHLFHCVVDERRLPFRWLGYASRPTITTVLPYLDIPEELRSWRDKFLPPFNRLPLEILGKNDKSSTHCADPRITGTLSEVDFFAHIASSRAFVECQYLRRHQRFTPLEAIAMGVPTLFMSHSGLVDTFEHFLPRDNQGENRVRIQIVAR